MRRTRLSVKLGPALDPCAAIQVSIELVACQTREIVFMLCALGANQDRALITTYSSAEQAHQQLDKARQYWRRTLSAVRVSTPDPAIDVLANGWLIYQTMACRLWARSGFYHTGGAHGFRDQLQHVTALVHVDPKQVRGQLPRSAAPHIRQGH